MQDLEVLELESHVLSTVNTHITEE